MKKGILSAFLVGILIFSLGLNILLLYDKLDNSGNTDSQEQEIEDSLGKDESGKTIKYNKKTLSNLFKNYQVSSGLAKSDDCVVFDVTKITYVGYFDSNNNKKLYHIDEKFSCMEGNECVNTIGKVTLDDDNNNNTTFVVAVTPVDKESALFEILDYSIEESKDFKSVKNEIIK